MTLFAGASPHLHECTFDQAFKETHLGQAHLAGTGPKGMTCRLCVHFGVIGERGQVSSPGYYGKGNKTLAGTLKPGNCNAPMPGKANRRFPHGAKACSLFEPDQDPYPVAAS